MRESKKNERTETEIALPQLVRWGPVDQKEPGITVEDESGRMFIPWERLKIEVEVMLLPQLRPVPTGSTAELRDLRERKDWLVRLISPEGKEIADLWLGVDADNKWAWDGLVRIGASRREKAQTVVWQIFQRYSDGSYRRIEALIDREHATRRQIGY